MTALDFLKSKGLIKDGFTEFVISGEFGQIELTKLLKEYDEGVNDVSQQRELLITELKEVDLKYIEDHDDQEWLADRLIELIN